MGVRQPWIKWFALPVLIAALALAVAPVRANYIAEVGSDYIGYRTASCGAPIFSILGGDPGLGGGSPHPIGKVNADQACGRVAGRRLVLALSIAVLVAAIAAMWLATTRRPRGRSLQPATTNA